MGGWVGGVEEKRIKPPKLSTELKLKLKLNLAIVTTKIIVSCPSNAKPTAMLLLLPIVFLPCYYLD